jgi:hypothetical protein
VEQVARSTLKPTVVELPKEAERLLALGPTEFVPARNRLARELRASGQAEEAAVVAGLRKPPAPVLAVNRASRDRPQAARAAVVAAKRVEKAHGGGDPDAFRTAVGELDDALELLADVAVAHVAPPGKEASEAMRRRVYDLLRRAVATEASREGLARGALLEEPPAADFSSLSAVSVAPPRQSAARADSGAARRDAVRQKRVKALRGELKRAEQALAEAERAAAAAERERSRAERAVVRLRAELDALS